MPLKLAVIGAGKLGAPLAALLASHYEVLLLDKDEERLRELSEGRDRYAEPGLTELLQGNRPRWRPAKAYADLADVDVCFIVVPTPSTPERPAFSNLHVCEAIGSLVQTTRESPQRLSIVLVSTVMPESCQREFWPQLTDDYELVYAPSFIALGMVLQGLRQPDFVLLGERCEGVANDIAEIYRKITGEQTPQLRTSWVNAELAKLSLNYMLSQKIATANLLQELCQLLPGGDVDEVTRIIGSDRRIGQRFLSGGMCYGGPCLPRDVRALRRLCQQLEVADAMPRAVEEANLVHHRSLRELCLRHLSPQQPVAIPGLAYRLGSHLVNDSPALWLAEDLQIYDHPVHTYTASTSPGPRGLIVHTTLQGCLDASRVIVLTQRFNFAGLSFQPGTIVIDCWRKNPELAGRVSYVPWGRNELREGCDV